AAHVYFRNRVLNLLTETAVVVEELLYPFKKGRFKEAPVVRPARTATPAQPPPEAAPAAGRPSDAG
ncbi:MAG TPA: hypothetical protein VMZ92_18710, partial [Planctomycetota bacterium]|nr:hypothetical protein [Planctomycetota bacterium]